MESNLSFDSQLLLCTGLRPFHTLRFSPLQYSDFRVSMVCREDVDSYCNFSTSFCFFFVPGHTKILCVTSYQYVNMSRSPEFSEFVPNKQKNFQRQYGKVF